MSKRRTDSPEFKARVAMEANNGRKTLQEIAAVHAIHPIQVSQWDRKILEDASDLFTWGEIQGHGREPEQGGRSGSTDRQAADEAGDGTGEWSQAKEVSQCSFETSVGLIGNTPMRRPRNKADSP
ncbi:helix-turn-helix domain-containing protein [Synechococcus sp. CBW1107]|uniref:helix-turn-helix domain-containing protein n=1 Tax=Synechococcus sp. CBW1107 TaxID=2789857 RepID=UPI002AD50C7D|nr:helix-turn-helix domain-containing protein [Synechococcus sp. CBW1107]